MRQMDRRENNFRMRTVSIIVPVYYGQKYIAGLIKQTEAEKEFLEPEDFVELILVNDAPDDPLPADYHSGMIKITVLNTDHNRGIHGARVFGTEQCHGEFILFLDQDDRIEAQYLKSQMECIGDADAAVCRCIHEKMPYYNAAFPFERMITKEYMLTEGCPVISPGQVLLRKSSIPEVWMKNIMKSNCADDFLLWLCMAGENRRFALNQEILFEHIVEYDNSSWDSYRMTASEQEMAQILIHNHVFPDEETLLLKRMLKHIEKKRMEKLDKFRKMFYILNDWTMLDKTESGIGKYLKKYGYRNIAVYGIGYLGKHLLWELKDSGICVQYVIDRNADWLQENYTAYTLEDELQPVDAVIVTLVQGEGPVIAILKSKMEAAVFSIKELVKLAGGKKVL